MKMKLMGISGSPRPAGNTYQCLQHTLDFAQQTFDVETEIISLARKNISDCMGCHRCWNTENDDGRICRMFEDDMNLLYHRLASADGYIFATPTYFGNVTGLMKNFLDRLLPFYDSAASQGRLKGALKFKPAGGMVLAQKRNDGIEAALDALHKFFLYQDLVIASAAGASRYGVNAVSSNLGAVLITGDKPNVIHRDKTGMNSAKALVSKIVELVSIMNRSTI